MSYAVENGSISELGNNWKFSDTNDQITLKLIMKKNTQCDSCKKNFLLNNGQCVENTDGNTDGTDSTYYVAELL